MYLLMNKIKIEFSPLDPKVISSNLVKGIDLTHSFTCGFEEAPSRSASKFKIASVFFIFLSSKMLMLSDDIVYAFKVASLIPTGV
jgi:hypothetical protein